MLDRRGDLPAGTVTFVFTDLESSTKLLLELGDEAYAQVLEEHRRSVRAVTSGHGGVEVDTQGDAFFLVFRSAESAAAAAADIAGGIAHGPVRPRIGVHTGDPWLGPEGYVGADVHLAARIAGAAHGGQVLVSGTTRAYLTDPTVLVDLGEHRLKDIAVPVRLHQLGTGAFPALRTVANSTIPHPTSSFVGREGEVAALRDVLRSGARLVTLTGPGGTGKTRLAIEAVSVLGERYPAGMHWVPLRTVADPALVLPAIGTALGTTGDLAADIADREMLLLVDNAEQVASAAPVLGDLLAACPNLSIIVTSRARLRLAGEVEFPIEPMALVDAVALFAARSGYAPDDVVEAICRGLDALPLAVELAAARTSILSPSQILDRLGSRLDLLEGGRELDARPQTLRSTIDWSYELLGDAARSLFRRLSVFPGGATFEAIDAVLKPDIAVLSSLVDQSLVRRTGDRFWMLAAIHQYAADTFAGDGDRSKVEAAFRDHVLRATEEANRQVRGRDQLRWMSMLDDEAANIRAAFAGYVRAGDPDGTLRLVIAAGWWQARRGYLFEARAWEAASLEMPGGDPVLRGWVMVRKDVNDRPESAVEEFRRAEALAREAGDDRLLASALESRALATPTPDGDALLEEAEGIFRRLASEDDLARLAINRVAHDLDVGRDAEALEASDRAIGLVRRTGNRHGIGLSLTNKAIALVLLGRPDDARGCLREALAQFQEVGEVVGQVLIIEVASAIASDAGREHEAAVLLGAAVGLEGLGLEPEPSDLRIRARTEEALASLDPDVRGAWLDEGARLELEAAVDVWRALDASI